MKLKTTVSALVAIHLALLPELAQAQSSGFNSVLTNQGTEARLSFKIPLGRSSKAHKTAPRLEFGIRNYSQTSPNTVQWKQLGQTDYREAHLGFTLNKTPQLMLNDELLILSQEDEQTNLGTPAKVGLGVGALALVGVAVIAVAFAVCDSQDGGCFGEE